MKNFLTAFIVFMIWSLFGLWVYSWVQPENITAKAEVETPIFEKIQHPEQKEKMIIESKIDTSSNQTKTDIEIKKDTISLTIPIEVVKFSATNSQGEIIFLFEKGITIKKNRKEIFSSEESKIYKYKINSFLIEHTNLEVHINSIYSPQENVSIPNIGIQRAQEVEKELLAIGVPSEKIVKKSIIKNSIFSEEEHHTNGFYFTFEELDIERVDRKINSQPEIRIVYPKYLESDIEINNDLKSLLVDLKQYFKEYPNKKVDIVGHTDSIGNSSDNYTIGLKYAQQVRWYLINKGGIKKTSLIVSSKGESEPLDSNSSKQGRNENRRIEIIFR
ncbi:MAG: OOP family OmpA-OmpF porin [bacterium]|jgi:OOP family OmpA-OmpF porin